MFKVTEGSAAEEQKIHVGWVIRKINGEEAPANKVALMKVAAAAMKQGPVKFTFQTPMEVALQTHAWSCCPHALSQPPSILQIEMRHFVPGKITQGTALIKCSTADSTAPPLVLGWHTLLQGLRQVRAAGGVRRSAVGSRTGKAGLHELSRIRRHVRLTHLCHPSG